MQAQDSSDPTGVRGQERPSGSISTNLAHARHRKGTAAIGMRLAGASWAEIAQALGYPTPRQALVATEKALAKELDNPDDKDRLRRLAGARLDRLLRSAWPKAINPDHPDHLIALTKCREVIGDHRKLFGLDAPTEVVVHNPSTDELDAWVARIITATMPPVAEYDIFEGEVVSSTDEQGGPDAVSAAE